ncbi:MAG: hypothetical protein V4675_19830 [Verrucomicrobiota bacterium]
MWEFLRKIALTFSQVPQLPQNPIPQKKSSFDSTNRPAGLEELALLIPTMGSDESISSLEQLIAHSDVYVRGDAKRAAAEAVTSGKATELFRTAFWNALVQDLLSEQVSGMDDPVRFLMKLDKEKTLNLLHKPAFLRPDHPLFTYNLQTLVSHSSLDCATISRLRRAVPGDADLQNTLRFAAAKAHCPGIGAELDGIIADQLARQPCDFQECDFISASRARLVLSGLTHPQSLIEGEAERGTTQVKEDLDTIDFLSIIGDYLLYDGAGFAGLFSMEACNDPEDLIAPLRRLSLWKNVRIFEAAIQLFTKGCPWPSLEARKEMWDALNRTQEEEAGEEIHERPFAALEAEWMALNRDLVIAAEEYGFKAAIPVTK